MSKEKGIARTMKRGKERKEEYDSLMKVERIEGIERKGKEQNQIIKKGRRKNKRE